jgi:4-hydroxy-2-oxoglutarate aldolase
MTLDAVFPPMPTPFARGEVDVPAIDHNVERWMHTGLGGVVALGTNGEAPLLDDDEADRVIGAARTRVPGDRVLIAGTGRESTRSTMAACRRAASLGADYALVRTPSFFKGAMTAGALLAHYRAVADASPVPVLLYNYPALTGVNLPAEAVARLAEHQNIAGIKETSTDAASLSAFVDSTPTRFAVIAGSAPAFYAGLCVGARGGILAVACIVPDLCVALHQALRAGRHDEARELQCRITPLARLVTTVHGVPGLKAAMDLAGYKGGEPRGPLAPAPPAAIDEIRTALARLQQPA